MLDKAAYGSLDVMPKPKRNDVVVKVDAEVIRLAKIVAAYRNQDLNVYLSEVLGPIVHEHLADHAANTSGCTDGEKPENGKRPKKPK